MKFNNMRIPMKLSRTIARFYSVRTNLKNNPIEDAPGKEFRIKLNGDFATVEYKKIDSTTYDLIHASIPVTYQGQGLGQILAERVFDHLVQKKIYLKVSCEYLQDFLKANGDRYAKHILN